MPSAARWRARSHLACTHCQASAAPCSTLQRRNVDCHATAFALCTGCQGCRFRSCQLRRMTSPSIVISPLPVTRTSPPLSNCTCSAASTSKRRQHRDGVGGVQLLEPGRPQLHDRTGVGQHDTDLDIALRRADFQVRCRHQRTRTERPEGNMFSVSAGAGLAGGDCALTGQARERLLDDQLFHHLRITERNDAAVCRRVAHACGRLTADHDLGGPRRRWCPAGRCMCKGRPTARLAVRR